MFVPSENGANGVTPTSIPTAKSLAGSGLGVYSNTKVANHPETVRLRVQVFTTASAGSSRLNRTLTFPILDRESCLPAKQNPDCGYVNESNRCGPLNLGNPNPERKKFLKDLSTRSRTCCKTWEYTFL